jgi:Ca-activated chloride channel family protein
LPKLSWLPAKSRFLHKELLWRMAIFILMVIALAAPISFSAKVPSNRKGVAIVLALDTSGSMRESGFGKGDESKFELLQRLASDFMEKRFGDNIGVVAFGTFAFTASPVSYDIAGVKALLQMLEVEIAGKNTAIGEAIVQSLKTLQQSKAKEKIIILVTDGKNNSGKTSPKEAVKMAKEQGVKIYTIGLGESKMYDAPLLEKIAKESGGEAFGAVEEKDLQKVYAQIDTLLPSPLRSAHYLHKKALFIYPLLAAVLLLLIYLYKRRNFS